MKTQPDVSAWFFIAGLILLLRPGSETHNEGTFFSDSFRSRKALRAQQGSTERVKASKNAESPRGIIPKESRTGRTFCSDRSANTLPLVL